MMLELNPLRRILQRPQKTRLITKTLPVRVGVEPPWETCSDVFYLLNTVKVYYESSLGKLTLEDLNVEMLTATIESLRAFDKPDTSCPVYVTVCGVTWDVLSVSNCERQKRIRAIPKAAGLRFFDDQRAPSDAYFYQANRIAMDTAPSDYFTDRLQGQATSVENLNPKQFIGFLQNNNKQFITNHGESPYLRKANFEAQMTRHEQATLDKLLHQSV